MAVLKVSPTAHVLVYQRNISLIVIKLLGVKVFERFKVVFEFLERFNQM